MRNLDELEGFVSRLYSGARSSLVVNAFYIMSSHALMAVLGFVFWVIVARFYSEAELGYSAAIISALGLVSMIGSLGLNTFVIRFQSRSLHARSLINTCLTFASVATLAVALLFVAGIDIWSPRLGFVRTEPVFMAAFVCFAIANTLSALCSSAFIAGRKSRFLLLKDGIFALTKLFLPLLFLQYFHAFGIVASWGLATAGALFISLVILLPRVISGYKFAPEFGARIVRRAWGFSGLNYVIGIVGSTPQFLMPLIVINLLGPEQNGFFYIAWAISSILFSIPGSIAQSLFAEGSYDRSTLRRNIARSLKAGFALLLPAILFLVLLGDRALLAFGYDYAVRSMDLLRILALAGIPVTIVRIYFAVLRVNGRLKELLAWKVALSMALLSGSYYVVGVAGITAIGWVYLCVLGAVAVLIIVSRKAVWGGKRTSSTNPIPAGQAAAP